MAIIFKSTLSAGSLSLGMAARCEAAIVAATVASKKEPGSDQGLPAAVCRFAVAAAGGGAVGCGATLLYLQRKKQLGAEAPGAACGVGLLSAGVCWPVRGSGGGVISSALLLAGAEFGELASHPALKYGELLLAGTLAVHLSGRAAPTNCQGRKQPGVPVVHAGMPVSDRLRTYPHFVAYFDTRLRNPKWTLEHISDATLRGGTGRR